MSVCNNPETSVILPFFNAEQTLKEAIDSVRRQSYTNFELILIENNGIDRSVSIARDASLQDKRIVTASESRQGVHHAMNKGLKLARGRFIARMDADDIMHPERLERQTEFLNENKSIDVVGTQVKFESTIKESDGFRRWVDWSNSITTYEEIRQNMFIELPVVNPTLFFRRELTDLHGPFTAEDVPEDYEMILRWLEKGVRMEKLKEQLLVWRDFPTRITRTNPRYSNDAFFKIKSRYLYQWLKKHNPMFPNVVVWGAGQTARRRLKWLLDYGVNVVFFIDVKAGHRSGIDCISYEKIAPPGNYFVLSYVSGEVARTQIRNFLIQKGYTEMVDFVVVA